ncbi:MAG: type II toxin-antitoxin system PemK/MazF family toxin [Clostridia bacterium]|nr:type II toxin-antitoxin system PemK/MazF family toxin [Clostridia bacterium]
MYNAQNNERAPLIGEVYNMYFSGTGSEQSGWRPGVVFQNNIGNVNSPNIIALPLTSSLKKLYMPTHVLVKSADTGLKCDSMVICENPEKMSKEKVGKFITTLPQSYMRDIVIANLIATSAISFLDKESLISVWEKAIHMNCVA